MGFIKLVLAYVLAVVVGTVLVTTIATQINLQALVGIGAEIPMNVRIDATLRDLAGFTPTMGPILVLGYLIAFVVASLIIRVVPSWRTFGYTLAGFVTIIAVMLGIEEFYAQTLHSNITPVPAARTMSGLIFMSLGGALGGLTFAFAARRA